MTLATARSERVTLAEAARRTGVNSATIHRWATKGVRGIRLEATKLGHTWYTTGPAIERFAERCTAASIGRDLDDPADAPSPRGAA